RRVPVVVAAGEVAARGVRGPDRLASNSLLEGLVCRARAVEAAALYGSHLRPERGPSVAQDVAADEAEDDRGDRLDMEKLLNSLRRLMWEKVGIIRSKQGLLSALMLLEKWEERLKDRCRTRRELEVRNMVTVGHLVATAALQ